MRAINSPRLSGETGEVADGKQPASNGDGKLRELLVREGEEFIEQAELMQQLEGGGMDGVSRGSRGRNSGVFRGR